MEIDWCIYVDVYMFHKVSCLEDFFEVFLELRVRWCVGEGSVRLGLEPFRAPETPTLPQSTLMKYEGKKVFG